MYWILGTADKLGSSPLNKHVEKSNPSSLVNPVRSGIFPVKELSDKSFDKKKTIDC